MSLQPKKPFVDGCSREYYVKHCLDKKVTGSGERNEMKEKKKKRKGKEKENMERIIWKRNKLKIERKRRKELK